MSNVTSKPQIPSGPGQPTNREVTEKAGTSWNPWLAIVFVAVVYFGAQIFGALLVSIYPALHHWPGQQATAWIADSVSGQFVFFVLAEGFTIGAVYLFLRWHRQGFSSIGLHRPRWRDLGYGLAAVPPYFLLYVVTVALISAVAPSLNIDQKQQIGFDNVHGGVSLLLTFISLVILPPLAEEIIVRGLLYTSFKKVLPTTFAVIATSALFAAAHLPEGGAAGPLYIAAIDTFVLSLVLIYLREKTGSLWASITLHAIKNGIAYFALFIVPLVRLHI